MGLTMRRDGRTLEKRASGDERESLAARAGSADRDRQFDIKSREAELCRLKQGMVNLY